MATRRSERRFEIVPMREGDLDDIMEIEKLAFRAPWSRQVFVEELERDWAHVDVLRHREKGAHVIAFVNYWLVRDEVHVLNVATHPDASPCSMLMHHGFPLPSATIWSDSAISSSRRPRWCALRRSCG